ncbi:MAG TPA: DUF465 domain-containing protein [Acidobacteriota bacterium]|nr:DUF465 domain-containing protein [Acidobacteriota bacterium]
MDETKLREYLAQNDEEFRQLSQQHREFDQQLEALIQKPYPSEDDQLRETILKKKKLALKDQMQMRINQYVAQQASG